MVDFAGQSLLTDAVSRGRLVCELDRRFRKPLAAYFQRRVGSVSEAQDLTQDVFERLLRELNHRHILNAEALVFTIAANLLRDRARKVRTHGIEHSLSVEHVVEFAEALTVEVSPERVVFAQRSLDEALRTLGELSERTQTIFFLHRFEYLKVREIAEMLRVSPSAVEKHITKALRHLVSRLDPE